MWRNKMYTVRNSQGQIVLMATRKADAAAVIQAGKLDKEKYTLEVDKPQD